MTGSAEGICLLLPQIPPLPAAGTQLCVSFMKGSASRHRAQHKKKIEYGPLLMCPELTTPCILH